MNPIMKCCGYYCTCIIMVSFFFYGMLIYLIKERNWWIIRDFPNDTDSKIKAITIAMVVNGICLLGCVGCLVQGQNQEKREAEEKERREMAEFEDDGDDLKLSQ